MRLFSLVAVALLLAVLLFAFGCPYPNPINIGNKTIINKPNNTAQNISVLCASGYSLGIDGLCHAANNLPPRPVENNSAGNNGSGDAGTNANDAIPPQALALEDFRSDVCNDIPSNAMHLLGNYVAVLIPNNLTSDLGGIGDSITVNSQYSFVDTPDPHYYVSAPLNSTEGRYYWNCWANGGPNTHLCIIPITAQINLKNGTVLTQNGAIKLTFQGGLEPLKSACNWTPPSANSSSVSYTYSGSGPRPQAPDLSGPISVPPSTPECTSPPVVATGEMGPTDVYPWMMRFWIPHDEILPNNSTAPGPLASMPTFNRTDCDIFYDPVCPDQEGSVLCGECTYSNTLTVITYDQFHTSPGTFVSNLGQCKYCSVGSSCSGSDAYGICGKGACLPPAQPPSAMNFYINCGQCPPDDSQFKKTYPDRSYVSWADCISRYNWCHETLNCGRILDNCRGHQPSS